jgi:hypothetical protein
MGGIGSCRHRNDTLPEDKSTVRGIVHSFIYHTAQATERTAGKGRRYYPTVFSVFSVSVFPCHVAPLNTTSLTISVVSVPTQVRELLLRQKLLLRRFLQIWCQKWLAKCERRITKEPNSEKYQKVDGLVGIIYISQKKNEGKIDFALGSLCKMKYHGY